MEKKHLSKREIQPMVYTSVPQSPAREGFQFGPRAFPEMFGILTVSCKWNNVKM